MGRFQTFFATLVTVLTAAWGAAAQDTATTTGTTQVQERGGIEVTGEVLFQDIQITPDIQLDPVITSSSTSTANLAVLGDASAVSIAVPDAVDVTVAGGGDSLTIITATDGGQAGVIGLAGLVTSGEALSIDIGGEISVRPEDLAPGEYRGLLVVVAQYN